MMLLLLAHLALADSFLTSVALPTPPGATVPTAPGPCAAEVAQLAPSGDAFLHAMVLGACHGYDANPALIVQVSAGTGALHNIDLGWTLMYAATYAPPHEGSTERAAVAATRRALKDRPDDARVHLVAALVLAQDALFIRRGSWDVPSRRTREVVSLVREAVALNRTTPTPGFDAGLRAAVDYMVLYGVFSELAPLTAASPASLEVR